MFFLMMNILPGNLSINRKRFYYYWSCADMAHLIGTTVRLYIHHKKVHEVQTALENIENLKWDKSRHGSESSQTLVPFNMDDINEEEENRLKEELMYLKERTIDQYWFLTKVRNRLNNLSLFFSFFFNLLLWMDVGYFKCLCVYK